jgi:hypothetical protein
MVYLLMAVLYANYLAAFLHNELIMIACVIYVFVGDCSAEAREILAGAETAIEKILLILQDYDIASKE